MRYHFNICDAAGIISDSEGDEFATLEAARDEARASMRDLMMDDLRGIGCVQERHIEITDHRGTVLDSIG
ncbi:MAG TPA: hypothetical protein VEM35_09680, partial [Rhizomicrobium sp.]|nr:hypothetical protein [Rhizomicrobium sp.]